MCKVENSDRLVMYFLWARLEASPVEEELVRVAVDIIDHSSQVGRCVWAPDRCVEQCSEGVRDVVLDWMIEVGHSLCGDADRSANRRNGEKPGDKSG